MTTAQLVNFPTNVCFGSNFEPVDISQKLNFLVTHYDYRKLLKASGIHGGINLNYLNTKYFKVKPNGN